MPDPLEVQVPIILEVLDAFGISVRGADGYEADDVIGTLATGAAGPVDVVTGDRDLFQVVDDDAAVRVLYIARGVGNHERVDNAWMQAKYGVDAAQYADFATLRGDASDGLPGVAGVGEKTAATLLNRFGDMAGIVAAAEDPDSELGPGPRGKIKAAADYLLGRAPRGRGRTRPRAGPDGAGPARHSPRPPGGDGPGAALQPREPGGAPGGGPDPMSHAVKTVLCIAAWWAVVVLPAVLTLAGVFGDFDEDSEISGGLTGVWIGAFLAQIAVLYLASRVLGHVRQWWFIIASMLPWAVNWAAPFGLGWGLLWIGIAGVDAVAMALLAVRSINLEERGTVVTATVKKVLKNHMNVVINNVYIRRRVLLDVPGANGSYEAVLPMLCEIGTSPDPGDKLKLRVDPHNPKHFALDPSHFHDDD